MDRNGSKGLLQPHEKLAGMVWLVDKLLHKSLFSTHLHASSPLDSRGIAGSTEHFDYADYRLPDRQVKAGMISFRKRFTPTFRQSFPFDLARAL